MGIKGIAIESDSTEKQVGYINDELVNLRDLGKKQLVPMTRVYAMEREVTRPKALSVTPSQILRKPRVR